MITVEKVLKIHDVLIHEFGGKAGIRDLAVLESAINRPFTGVADQEFYPTIEEKAAVYLERIVAGHPFSDGNKRTGYVLMRLFLLENNKDILVSEDEKYELVISVASGRVTFDEIVSWIKRHITTL